MDEAHRRIIRRNKEEDLLLIIPDNLLRQIAQSTWYEMNIDNGDIKLNYDHTSGDEDMKFKYSIQMLLGMELKYQLSIRHGREAKLEYPTGYFVDPNSKERRLLPTYGIQCYYITDHSTLVKCESF